MKSWRILFLLTALVALAGVPSAARADQFDPTAPVKELCDALTNSMKKGKSMDFAARKDFLAPVVQRDFDLPLMTKIAAGSTWQSLGEADRQKMIDAFTAYSVANYASQFNSYDKEHFEVDPNPAPITGGDYIVHTKLFTGDPEPVQLDYRVRKSGDRSKIIDIYLNGTISQMAARRSEYSAILRQGGAPALIDVLNKKAADLAH